MTSPKTVPLFQVDTFTNRVFNGNPAAVCLVEQWLPDMLMQSIAMENNLSETTFVIIQPDNLCRIRWFTPTTEVQLCGHATLAAAFVVMSYVRPELENVRFLSPTSGNLGVHRDPETELLYLNFPSLSTEPWTEGTDRVLEALGIGGSSGMVLKSLYDLIVVLEGEEEVRGIEPDFAALSRIDVRGVIVTSTGREVDFVSRFFAPATGILEDPVTGSAHCALIPYWSERLQKTKLLARQLSKRGGVLHCEDLRNGRVEIGGHAILFSRGEVILPP